MIETQFLSLTDSCKRLKQKRADLATKKGPRPSKAKSPAEEP
jgi:hypothetical protein